MIDELGIERKTARDLRDIELAEELAVHWQTSLGQLAVLIEQWPVILDSIGCIDLAKDFIVAGTASDQLFGTCEGLWEPDLEPEDLFETISQALLNAVDRDALSGWGAHVYIIEKDKVTKRLLKGRQD